MSASRPICRRALTFAEPRFRNAKDAHTGSPGMVKGFESACVHSFRDGATRFRPRRPPFASPSHFHDRLRARHGRLALAAVGGNALALLCALSAAAHDSDFSTLQLRVQDDRIEGTWDIHLADARIVVGLDGGEAGETGWRELREREPVLRALLLSGLEFRSGAGICPVEVERGFEESAEGRALARLRLRARCPDPIATLSIEYRVLFDRDPKHRGYFSVQDARLTHAGVFTGRQRSITLDIHRLNRWRTWLDYTREGVWHIWTGSDHVLFLLALLLPAPLLRDANRWRPRSAPGPMIREVVKIVTAFTLAHSVTLVLSVFEVLRLPAREVEIAIAFTVFVAAWNNLRPFLPERGWWLALGLGLLHGFGFAGALEQLGLPAQAKGLALLSFNFGVETGQLAILVVVLPALYGLSRRPGYVRAGLGAGSFAIAWISTIWMLERGFDFTFLPRL